MTSSTLLLLAYLIPLVIYWLIVLYERVKYGPDESSGNEPMIGMIMNVFSFVPVINIVLLFQMLMLDEEE